MIVATSSSGTAVKARSFMIFFLVACHTVQLFLIIKTFMVPEGNLNDIAVYLLVGLSILMMPIAYRILSLLGKASADPIPAILYEAGCIKIQYPIPNKIRIDKIHHIKIKDRHTIFGKSSLISMHDKKDRKIGEIESCFYEESVDTLTGKIPVFDIRDIVR